MTGHDLLAEEEHDEMYLTTLPRRRVEQAGLISLVILATLVILVVIWILFMVQSAKDNWYAWPLWFSIVLVIAFFVMVSTTIKRYTEYRQGLHDVHK